MEAAMMLFMMCHRTSHRGRNDMGRRRSTLPSFEEQGQERLHILAFMYVWMWQMFFAMFEPIAWRYTPRDWWMYPRQKVFWKSIHCGLWSEARLESQHKFLFAYRMSYESFHVLLDIIKPYLSCSRDSLFVRQPLPGELALACVLWRLAQGHSSKTMSLLYGVGESTIRKYTTIICRILNSERMFQRYGIVVPSGERLIKIMNDFESITGLPHMVGAIDGSHIRLHRKPQKELFPAQYICRHGFSSILVQGIVDSNKLFWSVVCKAPGGVHDSTHFKDSFIYKQLKEGQVLSDPIIQVQGEFIRPYIVGDSAYKAKTFLVKPFHARAGRHLHEKRAFDRQLSKGRVKVENTFGILKNRWRILRDLNVDLPLAPTIVGACCLLHNFVQMRGEVEPQEQQDPHPNNDDNVRGRERNGVERDMATRVRAALFRHYSLQNV